MEAWFGEWTFLRMKKTLVFMIITSTGYTSLTRRREVDFSVMHCAKMDTYSLSIFGTNLHPKYILTLVYLLSALMFYNCLIFFSTNFTNMLLITSTCHWTFIFFSNIRSKCSLWASLARDVGDSPHVFCKNLKTSLAEKQIVCGTTKDVVLHVGPLELDLVVVLVYDEKAVHFLSSSCPEIKWIFKSKLVYSE